MEPAKKVIDDLLELAAPIKADPDELLLSLIKSVN
jgi:hypothetical protein